MPRDRDSLPASKEPVSASGTITESVSREPAAERTVPLRFQRDLLLGEIDAGPLGTVAIFNTHLKSKTNRPWRLLAALFDDHG